MENIILIKYYVPFGRGFDWSAYFGGDDASGLYGFGHTEQEAVSDLMEKLEEDAA